MTNTSTFSLDQNGAPYSAKFNDIYFDIKTGSDQSKEIFIKTNNITEKLLSGISTLTIAETGFGSGLNFLLTLQAYQSCLTKVVANTTKQTNEKKLATLTYISVEKYPLNLTQLTQALSVLPELADLAQQLISQYPVNSSGKLTRDCQLSFYDNQVNLQLIFEDASQAFSSLPCPKFGLVDVWYLDGFSPSKNPAMWSASLFEQIARLSKDQADLSTFTISGDVRRKLMNVGFRIKKQATSGFKKEILTAKFQQNKMSGKGYQLRPTIVKPGQVAIIGGGIASACAAYALTKQGVKVTLYCKENTVAQGASSNAIGALYPLLHQQKDDISDFYQQAFWHAKALYNELLDSGAHFSHNWCGLLEVSYKATLVDRQHNFDRMNAWPDKLIHGVTSEQASEIAGIPLAYGGLFMPHAGWVAPIELVEQLLQAAKKTNRLKIETSVNVQSITQQVNGSWQLNTQTAQINEAILIVCGGAESVNLNVIDQLPLTAVRGQVTSMQSNEKIQNLSTVICHKGYLTPQNKGEHCIGATFTKDDFNTEVTAEDDVFNLNMLEKCLPNITDWTIADIKSSKARLRCMTPDHLPMVGAMPDIAAHKQTYGHLAKDKNWKYHQAAPVIDNLYVMTGFGARGLCSAPLIADILAADICGTPYPVDNKMLFNLSANRFVIRDIIKGKI